ncbi:plasmid pRiA4b ORF-3-like protein [bacterium BMS3Abin02]|nr:plasmid pRiA4b ORF-3-like protein [bacterium BMS3Abin02]GBE22477.1 plasmid pRiA4b ORF-3-like protein [bacterium BMS3Bbin01]
MGWLGGHVHLFDVDGTRYGMPDPDWDTGDLDEKRFRLGDILSTVGSQMRWDYDFGRRTGDERNHVGGGDDHHSCRFLTSRTEPVF